MPFPPLLLLLIAGGAAAVLSADKGPARERVKPGKELVPRYVPPSRFEPESARKMLIAQLPNHVLGALALRAMTEGPSRPQLGQIELALADPEYIRTAHPGSWLWTFPRDNIAQFFDDHTWNGIAWGIEGNREHALNAAKLADAAAKSWNAARLAGRDPWKGTSAEDVQRARDAREAGSRMPIHVISLATQRLLDVSDSRPFPAGRELPREIVVGKWLDVSEGGIHPVLRRTQSNVLKWLAHRYWQVSAGYGCSGWDDEDRPIIAYEEPRTRERVALNASVNAPAMGTSLESCRQLLYGRRRWLRRALDKRRDQMSTYSEAELINDIAAQLRQMAIEKITVWPVGFPSQPYVDWGWVIGTLARLVLAAATFNIPQMYAIAEEAGEKAKEQAANAQRGEDNYSELARQFAGYASSYAEQAAREQQEQQTNG